VISKEGDGMMDDIINSFIILIGTLLGMAIPFFIMLYFLGHIHDDEPDEDSLWNRLKNSLTRRRT
jgi:hypothetical protein